MTRGKLDDGDRQMLNAIEMATGIPAHKLLHEAVYDYLRAKYIKQVATTNGKK